jgi:hypothetical protein
MTEYNHKNEAKKCLAFLVNRLDNYNGGDKFITYGDLAKSIDYPEPHKGSYFGRQIGETLGVMGHLFDNINVPDWKGPIPYIQAMVVGQSTKLPSDGLKEFKHEYPNLSTEKKKDYVKQEYQRIFEFGERWNFVLEKLEITPEKDLVSTQNIQLKKLYNPFGSEGSPEHKKLRDYISNHPELIGFSAEIQGNLEYPLKSGDSVDVIFMDDDRVLGVEVKSKRSGEDDHERGIFQCIKYREVLKSEDKVNNLDREIDCILVHEEELTDKLNRVKIKLKVETKQIRIN